ncbi:MAG: glycosyltransferase family 4 protein [Patescibacteria group bacterium]
MISASFLPATGGVQFQVKYLSEALAEKGVELFLLSFNDGKRFLNKKSNGFPVLIKLDNKGIIYGTIELWRKIKEISPDVIHVHSAETQAFQIAFLKTFGFIKQPFIITSHGVDIMIQPEINYGFRLRPFINPIIRFILKKSAKHVIVGGCMKKYALDAGSKPEKIIEINNGVPLLKKEISAENVASVLNKFKIGTEPVLFSLSGMRPLKGIEYMVKAMPKIIKEFPSAKLILSGRLNKFGKQIKDLVDSMNLEKNIQFVGVIEDEEEKLILLRRADIFCKPSLLEACSVAIIEALKEGKAIVASIPGGIDIINDNVNGLLVKVKDSDDFAAKVINILKDNNLRKKIELGAEERAKFFDIEKIAIQYISLYEKTRHEN